METEQFKEVLILLENLGDGAIYGLIMWLITDILNSVIGSFTVLMIAFLAYKLIRYLSKNK